MFQLISMDFSQFVMEIDILIQYSYSLYVNVILFFHISCNLKPFCITIVHQSSIMNL